MLAIFSELIIDFNALGSVVLAQVSGRTALAKMLVDGELVRGNKVELMDFFLQPQDLRQSHHLSQRLIGKYSQQDGVGIVWTQVLCF